MKDQRNFGNAPNMRHTGYQTGKHHLLAYQLDLWPRLSARSHPKSPSTQHGFHFAQNGAMAHEKSSKQKSFHLANNQTGIAPASEAQPQSNEA
jgi:hypothetical protein